jgi:hypothetical protein
VTAREIVESPAWKLVAGAQLFGGRYDGLTLTAADVLMPTEGIAGPGVQPMLVLLFSDGSEGRIHPREPVAWLHPAGKPVR